MAKDPTDRSTVDFIPPALHVTRGQVLMDRQRHIAIVAKKGRTCAYLVRVKSGVLTLTRLSARELVEEWLRDNPDVAKQVERARRTTLPAVAVPPPTSEKEALDRARRRWRIRWIVLGTAIYFSTLPLSVTFNRSGFQGLLIDGWPERVVVLLIAAVLWAIYAVLHLRWRSPGR